MADSGLAQSIAIKSITNDFVDKMLAGSNRTNEAVAGVVAGLYFIFLVMSIINFSREKQRLHFLIIAFCCSEVFTTLLLPIITDALACVIVICFSCAGFQESLRCFRNIADSLPVSTTLKPKTHWTIFLRRSKNRYLLRESLHAKELNAELGHCLRGENEYWCRIPFGRNVQKSLRFDRYHKTICRLLRRLSFAADLFS